MVGLGAIVFILFFNATIPASLSLAALAVGFPHAPERARFEHARHNVQRLAFNVVEPAAGIPMSY